MSKSAFVVALALLLAACSTRPVPTSPAPTSTPQPPTPTPVPTPTLIPTATSTREPPTATPTPTPVPTRTLTPVPPVEVRFWHSQTIQQQGVLNSLAEAFNASHPGIHVTATYHAVLYPDLLSARSAPGSRPELVLAYASDVANLAQLDMVLPLDELMQDSQGGFSADDLKDIYPAFVDRYPRLGNRVYSVAFMRSMHVMYYNLDLLQGAGLAGPPETWDDFARACAAISRPPDVFCYEMAPEASTFANWVVSRGGSNLSADGRAAAFDQKAGLDALRLVDDLFRQKQALLATRALQEPSDFAAGKVAFTFDSTAGLAFYDRAVKSAVRPVNWGIAPLPHSTRDPVVMLYGPGLAILKTTREKQQAAFTFVKWLVGKEPSGEWARATGYLPARKSAGALLADYGRSNPAYGNALGWLVHGRAEPAVGAWSPIRSWLAEAMTAVASGKATPEETLREAARKANDALAAP